MDRRSAILQTARRNRRVLVEDLASALGVSAHTIRRDINALCAEAKLRRVHGGAEFVEERANVPYGARAVLNLDAKKAIAATVVRMIPDGSTVFVSIGTTLTMVAEALAHKQSLTIVTNNLNAAMAISENQSHRIILPGGDMRLPDRDLVGETAVELFAGHRADFGIYGVGGIDLDGSLLDFHEAEVRIRAQILKNSRRSILVADSSKFGRLAAAVGGRFGDADHAIIDRRPDKDFDAVLDAIGNGLIVVEEQETVA